MQLSTLLLALLATAATTLVQAAPAQQLGKTDASVASHYDRCFSQCMRSCEPLCKPDGWSWECTSCQDRCYPECGMQIP